MTKRIIFDGQHDKTFVAFMVFDPYLNRINEKDIANYDLTFLDHLPNIPIAEIVSHIPGLHPSVLGFPW